MHAPPKQEVSHQFHEAFRSWVESGNNTETPGTGETYTSLQYHWLLDRITICKFVRLVCQAILSKFQEEYLTYPTDPED